VIVIVIGLALFGLGVYLGVRDVRSSSPHDQRPISPAWRSDGTTDGRQRGVEPARPVSSLRS